MKKPNEACQTHTSKPRRTEACTQCPPNPPLFVSPSPRLSCRLPLRAVWSTYSTCQWMKKAQLSPSPNNARKTSKGHQSPLWRQYFPPILSCLSCPPGFQRHRCLIHHHHFLPTKMKSPREGSFWPIILPWMAKGLPLVTEAMLSYHRRHLHPN